MDETTRLDSSKHSRCASESVGRGMTAQKFSRFASGILGTALCCIHFSDK